MKGERAEVLAPYPQPLVITTLGGSVGTGEAPIDAEVVAFATLDALKAAPEGSLDGKIAVITNRMVRFKDGRGYGPAVGARSQGAVEAARKGAVAVLIRSIGTSSDRFAHTGTMRYVPDVPRIPAAALSNPDADLIEHMVARGKPVRLRLDIAAETLADYTSHNVIGEIRGRDLPGEVVTIGGHLDSWDLGTGAIDDGAGIGITFAAGALIGQLERAPRRTVRVIAYANEEQGLYGGKAYAEARAAAGEIDAHQLSAESDFGAGRVYALRAGVDPAAWPEAVASGDSYYLVWPRTRPGAGRLQRLCRFFQDVAQAAISLGRRSHPFHSLRSSDWRRDSRGLLQAWELSRPIHLVQVSIQLLMMEF